MYVMVLNDRDTFTNLNGCRIYDISEETLDMEGEDIDWEQQQEICEFAEATDHDGILVYWKESVDNPGMVHFGIRRR